MKRFVTALALLILCLFAFDTQAHAAEPSFSGELTKTEGHGGDTFSLELTCNERPSLLGAFLIEVNYDSSRFSCTRVVRSGNLQVGYTTSEDTGGSIRAIYSMNEYPLDDTRNSFAFYFKVNDDAEEGETSFNLTVTQIVSGHVGLSTEDFSTALKYTILPAPSDDATLLSATPSEGELVPAFSPDIFNYTLDVPFEMTTLTFETETAEGATCRVNRKNLGDGGSNTDFTLTVTAEDGETKQVYTVKVRRGEKATASPTPESSASPRAAAEEKPTATPKPTSSPKASPTEKLQSTSSPKSSEGSENSEIAAIGAVKSEPPSGGTGNFQSTELKAAPSLTIENGNSSLLPLALVLMFWTLMLFISKPLAKLICAKLDKDEDEE